MAVPLLAPLAPLMPVINVLALGSLKFVGIGIGAAVAPVLTANFLVGLSAGTPLKYAQFRYKKGRLSAEQMKTIEAANQLVQDSINDKKEHLNRSEARQFLKEILLGTIDGMKTSIISIPGLFVRFARLLKSYIVKPFSSGKR